MKPINERFFGYFKFAKGKMRCPSCSGSGHGATSHQESYECPVCKGHGEVKIQDFVTKTA